MNTRFTRPFIFSLSSLIVVSGLVACGQSEAPGAKTSEQKPLATATIDLPKAGTWRIELSHSQLGRETQTSCMTAEDVAETALFRSGSDAGDCTFARRVMQNGKVDIVATCVAEDGGQTGLETKGTYSPTGFDLVTQIKAGLPAEQQDLSFSVKGTHVSDTCAEDEAR